MSTDTNTTIAAGTPDDAEPVDEFRARLRVWLPAAPGRSRSVYLERSGKNYTDRELTLFGLLRPHLVRMHVDSGARRPSRPTTSLTMRPCDAPNAMRTPISAVRCRTAVASTP